MISITKRYSKQLTAIILFIISFIIIAILITKNQIEDTLIKNNIERITAVKNSLSISLNRYFHNKANVIKTISYNNKTKESLINFTNEFKRLEYKRFITKEKVSLFISNHLKQICYDVPNSTYKKNNKDYIALTKNGQMLQKMYIFGNKEFKLSQNKNNYHTIHEKYHHVFYDILKRHNFYDIFLIDKHGNIVYSVSKELDLGTNLINGIYKSTSLASAYKKSIKNNQLSFSDFKPYEPSFNEPAAFFSIPIKEKGKVIGAIAFQISIDEINNIMTFNKNWLNIGLGKTGEAYLIGQDKLMRSDSRFIKDIENKSVNKLNTTVGIFKINSIPIKNALNKENSFGIFKDYRNIDVLSSYMYIKVFDDIWGLIVEIDTSEIYEDIKIYINTILLTWVLIILILLFVTIYLLNKFVVEPIDVYEKKLEEKVKERTLKLNELNETLQEKVDCQLLKIREKDKSLLQKSRLAALGEMLNNIAHQWRQPLSVISTSSSSLSSLADLGLDISQEQIKTSSDLITEQTQYLSKTIDDLRDFVNEDISSKKQINLKDILEKCVDILRSLDSDIKYVINLDDVFFKANENHLIQVFINIIKNAIYALRNNEEKYLFISLKKEKDFIFIEFKDNGFGIEEDILNKIYDPYTTTKHKSLGTGLGLYMSHQTISLIYKGLIKSRNTKFFYKDKEYTGAEFIIELPAN